MFTRAEQEAVPVVVPAVGNQLVQGLLSVVIGHSKEWLVKMLPICNYKGCISFLVNIKALIRGLDFTNMQVIV